MEQYEATMPEILSVIGLGRIGLPVATFFASKGFRVIGVDTNPEMVEAVNNQMCPYYEPGLPKLMRKSKELLLATEDYKYAIENSDVTFVIVNSTDRVRGYSSLPLRPTIEKITQILTSIGRFHLIVLVSTVLPGDTEEAILPLLQDSGADFGLCYNPEFIALGRAIAGLTNPDVIVIGQHDQRSGDMLEKIYNKACPGTPIARTNIINAELIKLFSNTFITTKISFANTMSEICQRLPNADDREVKRGLQLRRMIGGEFLSPGLAYGGPCYLNDDKAISHLAQHIGVKAEIANAVEMINRHQKYRVIESVKRQLGKLRGKTIVVLGLTYKPDTDSTIESPSIDIIKELLKNGARVIAYDPRGMKNTKGILGEKVAYSMTAKGCLKEADLCIIATPWDEFKELTPRDFGNCKVLDPWRILENLSVNSNLSTWPS